MKCRECEGLKSIDITSNEGVMPIGDMTDLSISYKKNSKNNYTFTLTAFSYWNQYGLRVYLNAGGTWYLLGTQIITQAEYSRTDTYSKTITITKNMDVYGYIVCAYCEDKAHVGWPNGQEEPERWTHTTNRISLTFENTTPAPTAPTSVKLTGRYEQGLNPLCSWSGSTNATSHDIQRRYWSKLTNTYTEWEAVEWKNSSSSRYLYSCSDDYNCVQARVRANGAGGTSGWTESNWLYRQGVRVWNGSAWQFGYIRVWNGSSWTGYEGVYNHVYNGSNYVVGK